MKDGLMPSGKQHVAGKPMKGFKVKIGRKPRRWGRMGGKGRDGEHIRPGKGAMLPAMVPAES